MIITFRSIEFQFDELIKLKCFIYFSILYFDFISRSLRHRSLVDNDVVMGEKKKIISGDSDNIKVTSLL